MTESQVRERGRDNDEATRDGEPRGSRRVDIVLESTRSTPQCSTGKQSRMTSARFRRGIRDIFGPGIGARAPAAAHTHLSVISVDMNDHKECGTFLRSKQRFLQRKGYKRGENSHQSYQLSSDHVIKRDYCVCEMEAVLERQERVVYVDESCIHKNYTPTMIHSMTQTTSKTFKFA